MNKIFLLLILFFMSLTIIACGDNVGEFPKLNENNLVQLNAEEMISLFENLDYSVDQDETMRFEVTAAIKVKTSYEGSWSSETNEADINFNYIVYTLVSEQVSNVRLHAVGTLDIESNSNYTPKEGTPDINAFSFVGTASAYFYNQHLYLDVDSTKVENEDTEDVVFKQKIKEEVTQTMWEETYSEDNMDNVHNPLGFYFDIDEYLELLEDSDLDEIMEALPNLKVYRDGQTHAIAFEITKQGLIDSLEELIRAVAEEMMPDATEQDITEAIGEATNAINEQIDEMTFLFVITIKDDKIQKIAMEVNFVSEDENIEIDYRFVIDMNVTLPSFPSDLDTYDEVDYPGEGVID